MSPEQSILVAKNCADYYVDENSKFESGYLQKFDSCRKCINWKKNNNKCNKAFDILVGHH